MLRLPIVVGFLALLFSSPALSAEVARGVVFHDANGNGVRDPGEKPVAGVKVSNGVDVVLTDAAGKYELPVDDDTIIFVIKPRDWMTAVDEQNIPRFYYIHKPYGSPDDEFVHAGVEPTGDLPKSIDFPLTKSPESNDFTAILIGDPQPATREQVFHYANDTVAELLDTDADFVIALGDLVGDDLSLFEPLNQVHGKLGIPIYNVHGNHDMNFRSPDDEHADETFERVYGPANYAFQVGRVHFILLDNVKWKGFAGDNSEGKPRTGNYDGWLHDHQLEFVANLVKTIPKDDLIVICTHIPLPITREGVIQHSTPQYAELLNILSGHDHTLSLSGHTHVNHHFFAGASDGYTAGEGKEHHHHNMGTASGSWYRGPKDERGLPMTPMHDGVPNGYFICSFDGNKYSERFKAAHMPADYQFRIEVPEIIKSADSADDEVLVNVFNGTIKDEVRFRVADGDWITMDNAYKVDPAYMSLWKSDRKQAESEGRKKLPEPFPTNHTWTAKLPAGLEPGVHILEVESSDIFGQTHRGVKIIEVE